MAGQHHWCNGFELGQTLGDGEGQEVWHAAVHGVKKCWTLLGDSTSKMIPGESHQKRSLVGYIPEGHKEWDVTEVTSHVHTQ